MHSIFFVEESLFSCMLSGLFSVASCVPVLDDRTSFTFKLVNKETGFPLAMIQILFFYVRRFDQLFKKKLFTLQFCFIL